MRGSLRKRYKDSWNIIIDLSYQPDTQTGQLKRKQKWFTVHGTKRDAEKRLAELLHQANRHELVEPSKLTLGMWLDEWLETAIKPPNKRLRSYETYKSVIRRHLKPALGSIRLQQLQPTDLKRYYNAATLAPSTPGATSRYFAECPQSGTDAGVSDAQRCDIGHGQTTPQGRAS